MKNNKITFNIKTVKDSKNVLLLFQTSEVLEIVDGKDGKPLFKTKEYRAFVFSKGKQLYITTTQPNEIKILKELSEHPEYAILYCEYNTALPLVCIFSHLLLTKQIEFDYIGKTK